MDRGIEQTERNRLRLAQLLASRLCHDLSGPLGGLTAALGEAAEDAEGLRLAQDSARALGQRIALLRTAWGEPPPPLDRAGLRALAAGLPNAPRLQLDFDGLDATAFPPLSARLLANVLLLAAESLPGGGAVTLAGAPGATLMVRIAGRRAGWPAGLGAWLASAEAAWAAAEQLNGSHGVRHLQAPLTALLAHQSGVAARLLLAADALTQPPLVFDLSFDPST